MAIAWVNGVFFGFDQLRRLRRALSAQTRTEAKPRSDHRTMQQLRQGDAERASGERVSRPRRTRPAARGGRTSRDAVAGFHDHYFPGRRATGSSSSSARTERGGSPSRWCAPDGGFPLGGLITQATEAPPRPPKSREPRAHPPRAPPLLPHKLRWRGMPWGDEGGEGGEGGAAAGGMGPDGAGGAGGGALEERRHCTAARVGSTPL